MTSHMQLWSALGILIGALLIGAFIMGFFGSGSQTSAGDLRTISASDFKDAIAQPGIHLVDVRRPDEFAAGHIAGATDIDFYATDFQSKIAALDREALYAIYCHSGNRSGKTLAIMQQLGFKHVINLQGGISAWGAAAYPITTQ